ncbi:hypothetical protein ACFU8Q_00640 [Streptomyces sp. NPDC057543]|uniref:hypothetical protein n=1 Tax=Streptomyces sp. NPDC057543 TaxID=3346163 RepID=UPI0036753C01
MALARACETTDDHSEPTTSTVRATLAVPRGARGTYRVGLALPDPRFPGAADAVRCANATVDWVSGVNIVAGVRIGR